jgi:hypothetical protein
MEPTQGEVNHSDGQVPKPSVLNDLLGVSSTSMDVDPSSVNGETELNAYMRMQQVTKDTDPLMWCKQHQQEFPRLTRMTRQYLDVPASSSSPERLKRARGSPQSPRHTHNILEHGNICNWHTAIYVTGAHQYLSLEHTNIYSFACRLTVPHTWQSLLTINIITSIDKLFLISTQY